ncbi:Calpain-6 [Cichlidogyrus casuarinus]|uniref:Calpain-6 n=1 Tax=Cichlidogyrus casuarinus TaxID=1844966 RepID=A0ABD2QCD0_9PLAT
MCFHRTEHKATYPTSNHSSKLLEDNRNPGIFRVRIWEYGHYVDVVVDDLFPTSVKKPLGTHITGCQVIWPLLLEKAYAKYLGGYEALAHARLDQILLDLTGGVLECIDLPPLLNQIEMDLNKVELYDVLTSVLEVESGVICISKGCEGEQKKGSANAETGLLYDSGYILTKTLHYHGDFTIFDTLKRAFTKVPPVDRLLCLKCCSEAPNKEVMFGEWTGEYSNTAIAYDKVPEEIRVKNGMKIDSNSEFCISLGDFFKNFESIVICRWPRIKVISRSQKGKLYYMGSHFGSWNSENCGGDISNKSTFFKNPQYAINLTGNDKESSELLVSFSQMKHRQESGQHAREEELNAVGFSVLKVEHNRTTRANLISNCELIYTMSPKPHQSIFARLSLQPGRYILVPFTQELGRSGSFLLRLFMPVTANTFEMVNTTPTRNTLQQIFAKAYVAATRITVISCVDLMMVNKGKTPPSVYCVITCDSDKEETSLKKHSNNPVWEESYIFYRTNMAKPLTVTVMHKNAVGFDEFLGCFSFYSDKVADPSDLTVPLGSKESDKENSIVVKGSLTVRFQTVDNTNFDKI